MIDVISEWNKDPEFQKLDIDEKRSIISNFITQEWSKDPEFSGLPQEEQETIKGNFLTDYGLDNSYPGLLSTVGSATKRLPGAIAAAGLSAVRGGDIDIGEEEGWTDKIIRKQQEQGRAASKAATERPIATLPLIGTITAKDIAELPDNVAFSGVAALSGLGAALPLALVPEPTGATKVGAWAAGTAASGAVAYRMAKDQFTGQLFDFLNKQAISERGKGLTQEEWQPLKENYDSQASKYGLWEAIPEALSNAVSLGIVRLPVGKLLKAPGFIGAFANLSANAIQKAGIKSPLAKTLLTGAGKFTAILSEELLSEDITQVGQGGIEADIGMRKKAPTFVEAFKEIAPQTFLLTGLMAGGGAIGSRVYDSATGKQQPPPPPPTLDLNQVKTAYQSRQLNANDIQVLIDNYPAQAVDLNEIINESILDRVDAGENLDTIILQETPKAFITRSMGEVEEGEPVEGIKDTGVAPSVAIEGQPTPDMGPTNLQRLRGMLYGKKVRKVEEWDKGWEDNPEDPLASIAVSQANPELQVFEYGTDNESWLMEDLDEGKYFIQRKDGTLLYNPKAESALFDTADDAKKEFFKQKEQPLPKGKEVVSRGEEAEEGQREAEAQIEEQPALEAGQVKTEWQSKEGTSVKFKTLPAENIVDKRGDSLTAEYTILNDGDGYRIRRNLKYDDGAIYGDDLFENTDTGDQIWVETGKSAGAKGWYPLKFKTEKEAKEYIDSDRNELGKAEDNATAKPRIKEQPKVAPPVEEQPKAPEEAILPSKPTDALNIVKGEGGKFKAAYLDKDTGEVYVTGQIHDTSKLPAKIENKAYEKKGALVSGFSDKDGKFYTGEEALASLKEAPAEAPQDLLPIITSLQPAGQERALVSISELRDKAGMNPEEFDAQLLKLSQEGKVALHEHDFPGSLKPEEKAKLLSVKDPMANRAGGGEGRTYYVGVVPIKEAKAPTKAKQREDVTLFWNHELTKPGRFRAAKAAGFSDKEAERLSKIVWEYTTDEEREKLESVREQWGKEEKPELKASEATAEDLMAEWDKQAAEMEKKPKMSSWALTPETPTTDVTGVDFSLKTGGRSFVTVEKGMVSIPEEATVDEIEAVEKDTGLSFLNEKGYLVSVPYREFIDSLEQNDLSYRLERKEPKKPEVKWTKAKIVPTRAGVVAIPEHWEKVPGSNALKSTFGNYLVSGEPGQYRLSDETTGRVIGGTYTDVKTATNRASDDWIKQKIEEKVGEKPVTPQIIPPKAKKPKRGSALAKILEEEKAPISTSEKLITKLQDVLARARDTITWQDLFKYADEAYGGTQAEGKYTVKDAYDAMEVAFNRWALDHPGWFDVNASEEKAIRIVKDLKGLIARLPTQSKRTKETDQFQQFSTPPPFSYAVVWVANIRRSDSVFEPSGGTGNIATMAKLADPAKLRVNELSDRRASLLKLLPFDQVFQEDAEQLNNILPADVKPTVFVMNPPFSQTAGRMGDKKDTFVGARHVEQALKRLQPGGRLVAIVGRGMADNSPTFKKWWDKIKSEYTVRANINVNGKEYAKFGTHFDNQIIVIDKIGKTDYDTITGGVDNIEDLIPLLQGVRNERTLQKPTEIEGRTPKREPTVSEPPIEETTPESQRGPGTGQPVLSTTGALGTTEREPAKPSPRTERKPGEHAVSVQPKEGDEIPLGERREPVSKPIEEGKGRPEETGALDTGATSREADRVSAGLSEAEGLASELQVIAKQKEDQGEISENLYDNYKPERLKIEGAKPHPTPLVQSAAMAAVSPPPPNYSPSIPKPSIVKGKISDIQLEAAVYAGQAHDQLIQTGAWFDKDGKFYGNEKPNEDAVFKQYRRGYFIGDGTGVGKGREIAAIIWDNWNKGRKKALWITEKKSLVNDAKRDIDSVGWNQNLIMEQGKVKADADINAAEGILFTTYSTLRSGQKDPTGKSRLKQISDWLGPDFDGVIAFDEAHNMGNAVTVRGERGYTQPSQMALAAVELQNILPKARVLYVSATGATEVINLAYADRLGIWGEGTAFANKADFVEEVSAGGIAAMEMVARDLKAFGLYTARSLSYDGVDYDRIEHTLTKEQREIYNKAVQAWQVCLRNINEALEATGVTGTNPRTGDKVTLNGKAKGAAYSVFWGAHQRFFNQVITSMQTPSVIKNIHNDLKGGNAVVIQLTNTMEAAQERAIARLDEDETLEDLDLTPRDTLMDMVQNSFPVHQFQQVMDENGNIRSEIVKDSKGNPVENPEAVAMRDKLLDEIGSIKVPDSPLDMILKEFGVKNVAEVTGRRRRVVEQETDKGRELVIEKRSRSKAEADANAFMEGKKNILVFSEAGGTGRSYHSDLGAKNQKKRVHYLLQAGWRADKAVQGLGRTHRSNQRVTPRYFLVTTDLKGQKRFISSIARRLDQLGALTKGQRQTGSQGIFQARDNLESDYARDALRQFYDDLYRGRIPNITIAEFQDQTGLKLTDERTGSLTANLPPIQQFLNRLLSMDIDTQNTVFDEFALRMDRIVDSHARAGTLDQGLETLKASKIEKISDQVVHTDESTKSETKYVQLDVTNPAPIFEYEDAIPFAKHGFWINKKSGKIWAVNRRTITNPNTGDVRDVYVLRGANYSENRIDIDDFTEEKWEKISEKQQAKKEWNKSVADLPKTITHREHLIAGTLLPVWNRIIGHPRIMRIQTSEGQVMIGRIINPGDLAATLRNLGAESGNIKLEPSDIFTKVLDQGFTIELANNWEIVRRKVSDEERIEIKGPDYRDFNNLEKYGVFSERIQYVTRYFIPTVNEDGIKAIEGVIKNAPAVMATPPFSGGIKDISPLGTKSSQLFPNHPSASAIEKHLEPILAKLPGMPQVQVIESWEALPTGVKDFYKQKMKEGTYAALYVRFNNGQHRIFILADHQASLNTALTSLWHEAGHFALRKALVSESNEYNGFLDDIYNSKYKNTINTVGEGYGLDTTTQAGRRKATDEWWAMVTATEKFAQNNPWYEKAWDKFVAIVRKFLNSIGIKYPMGRSEIREMMRRSYREMEKPTPTGEGEGVAGAEGQKLQPSDVNTKEFRAWFKNSKVVDENGKPLVVYHGTDQSFPEFSKEKVKSRFSYSFGFHFTSNPNEASIYADSIENASTKWNPKSKFSKPITEGGNVIPAYIRAENPLEITTDYISASIEADENRAEIIKRLSDANKTGNPYDSVIIRTKKNDEWFGLNVIVFSPTQIKSIFNRGTWDESVSDISGEKLSPLQEVLAKLNAAHQDGSAKESVGSKGKRVVAASQVESNPFNKEAAKIAYGETNNPESLMEQYKNPDGTYDADRFYRDTGITVHGGSTRDLNKYTKWLQTVQDLAHNYPALRRALEVWRNWKGGANQMSINDRDTTESYFTLPHNVQLQVNKALVDGDRENRHVSNDRLERDYGLDENGKKAYWDARKALDEKKDLIVNYYVSTVIGFKGMKKLMEKNAIAEESEILDKITGAINKRNDKIARKWDDPKNREDADTKLREDLDGLSVDNSDIETILKEHSIADWALNMRAYIPHKWKENWRVFAKDKAGTRYVFDIPSVRPKLALSHAARNRAAKVAGLEVVKKELGVNVDAKSIRVFEAKKLPLELFEGTNEGVMRSIIDSAADKADKELFSGMDDAKKSELETIREAIKEHIHEMRLAKGWGAHLIGRKNVQGYRQDDLHEAIAEYLVQFNGWYNKGIAARKFAEVMEEVDPKETPQLWKYTKEYVSDMLSESSEAANFKKIVSMYFLAADVSAAALNMTQNFTHAVGMLRSIKGKTVAEQDILKAMKDVALSWGEAKAKGTKLFSEGGKYITQNEAEALRSAFEKGMLDPQYFGEVTGLQSNKIYHSFLQDIQRYLYIGFTASEGMNRMSTFLAAYRRARDAGLSDPVNKAAEITNTSHFIYGKGTRPEIIRKLDRVGPGVGSMMYTFMTYPMQNIAFLKNRIEDIKFSKGQDRKTAIKIIASNLAYIGAFGGLNALPFMFLFKMLYQWFTDPEDDWEKWIREHTPQSVGRAVTRGIPSVVGNDLSWKVEGTDILGAPIGFQTAKTISRRVENMWKEIKRGEEAHALFMALPDVVRNPYLAISETMAGTGIEGRPPIKYEGAEKAWKAMGFTPIRESEMRATQDIARRKREDRLEKIETFAERYLKAKKTNDQGAINKLMVQVNEYNNKEREKGDLGLTISWKKDIIENAKRRMKTREKQYPERMPKYMRKYQEEIGQAFE